MILGLFCKLRKKCILVCEGISRATGQNYYNYNYYNYNYYNYYTTTTTNTTTFVLK